MNICIEAGISPIMRYFDRCNKYFDYLINAIMHPARSYFCFIMLKLFHGLL